MGVRKKMLAITGVIVLLLIAVVVVLSGAYLPKKDLSPWDRAYASQLSDPRMQVLAHGILAANQHNMQPSLVRLDLQDKMAFWLYVDPDRLTPEVDPYARQAVITQGTLLEYVRIAGGSARVLDRHRSVPARRD